MNNGNRQGWQETNAVEYCVRVADGTHDTPKPLVAGEYLITSKHITSGKLDLSSAYRISKEDFDKINIRSKVDKWDVLLTMIGTVGEVVLVDREPNYAIKNIGLFKCGDEIKARWLKYYLQSPDGRAEIQARLSGTTQEYIPLGELRKLSIMVPPLPQQSAFVEVLSSLDDKIDLLHRQNKTLEGMAEALWRKMFVEEADPGWKKVKMAEIIEVRDGTHDSPKQTGFGFCLITSRHLKEEGIDYANAYKISEEDYIQINRRSKVDKNDILFSMIGTLGLIHYVEEEPSFAIKNIGLFKSSGKPHFAKYLYLLLKSSIGRDFIFENSDGSTQEYIALGNLRSFTFSYPGDNIIGKFDDIIEPFFNKIFDNKRQISTLSHLRDALLPKLMSGEVRVKV